MHDRTEETPEATRADVDQEDRMNTISTGEPATLGTYRKIAIALAGENSKAVQFFDEKIAASSNGENERVIAAESQVLFLISSMIESAPNTGGNE